MKKNITSMVESIVNDKLRNANLGGSGSGGGGGTQDMS